MPTAPTFPFTYPTPLAPGPKTGWRNFPTAEDSDILVWYFWIQFWYAVRERVRATGGKYFPQVSRPWAELTITGAVDNDDGTSTLTFAETFCTTPGLVPFVFPCDSTPPSDAPDSYECAIDDDDATKAIGNLPVVGIGTHTVTIQARLADYVTSKQWGSVNDAVGRTFAATRPGEPWWNDPIRIPGWPNAPTFITGTVLTATASKIRVDATTYEDGQWDGYEIMVRDTAGRLHRLTITDTTTDTTDKDNPVGVLTFKADKSGTPTGDFTVIAPGGMFMPGRPDTFPCQFYAGEVDAGALSHRANDQLDVGPGVPRTLTEEYDHSEDDGSPCACPPDTCTRDEMLDTDAKTPEQAVCVEPSHLLNPGVTRTVRYLENFCAGLSQLFLPQNTKQGSSKTTAFNGMAAATWYDLFGCDSYTTTIGGNSATVDPAAFEYGDGLAVLWAVKDQHGGVVRAGGATLTAAGSYRITGFPDEDNGRTIVVSPGIERWFEKTIGALTDRAWFEPDVDPDAPGPGTTYVDPPTAAHPGRWVLIPAPTHYQETNVFGVVGESTKDHYLFEDDDVARLIGLNWSDPTNIYGADEDGNAPAPAVHYDRAVVRRRSGKTQDRIVASMSGRVTTFTKLQLRDDTMNWWTIDFWSDGSIGDGGTLKTHSGTDFVSSSGLTLSSLVGTGFVTQTPPRFMVNGGATIRFRTGFDSSHKPIWIYRQLASQDSSGNVTFTEPMTVTGSMYWELREPAGRPNRWRGCDVSLTVELADGTRLPEQVVTLAGNGDRTLYLPAGVNIPANAVAIDYSIDDPQITDTCIVMERVAGKWKRKTDGHDAVRPGVTEPTDFLDDPYLNNPELMRDYGRLVPGDLVLPYMAWLKAGIVALKHRFLLPDWTAHPNPTDAAINNEVTLYSGSNYWGDNVDASNPRAVVNCDDGSPVIPFGWGGNDMLAFADAHTSGPPTSVEGASPMNMGSIEIGGGTSTATAPSIASFAKIAAVPGYGLIPNPGIVCYMHATLDGTVNCSYAGSLPASCGADSSLPNVFTAVFTPAACNDWSEVSGFSIYSNGSAYSGLVGTLNHGEWPTTISGQSPCNPAPCPDGPAPIGGGSGGWQADGRGAVATWSFVYGD